MKPQVYLIGGLGTDERVFQRLDLSEFDVHHVSWVKPEENEPLANYAKRLCTQIRNEEPLLIGLSFGGIIAIEIARQIKTKKVILISSVKTRKELPFYFRWAGVLRIHLLLRTGLLKRGMLRYISYWLFGTTSSFDRSLLKEILLDTDPDFFKWAVNQIVFWKQTEPVRENIYHIHGTIDRVLPLRFVKCDYIVKNGGHMMTLNRHEEITRVLREQLMKPTGKF